MAIENIRAPINFFINLALNRKFNSSLSKRTGKSTISSDINPVDTYQKTVKQGDTLSDIAKRHRTSVEALLRINPNIKNKDLIFAGDVINLPANSTYTIKHGDTLSKIAVQYGVSVQDIVNANNIQNPNLIYPNDTLIIPNQTSAKDVNGLNNIDDNSSSNSGSDSDIQCTPGKLPSTNNMSETQKFDLYSGIINKHGSDKAKQQLANNEKVALSLRVETNTNINKGKGHYDDRMVLIWKDAKGVGHVSEHNANLDPSGQYEHNGKYSRRTIGRDHDGDGRLDQGRLAEGTYTYRKGIYRGKSAFLSSSDQVTERDVNHNGVFDDNAKSPRSNYGMHIHIGGENNTYSAGCLTMAPGQHSKFFQTVGNQQTLTNVVVDTKSLKGTVENSENGGTSATTGKKLTNQDWQRAAQALGVDTAAIKAVADVEAPDSGFLSNGDPKILFESHHFSRLTGGEYDSSHPDISSKRWNRRLYKGGAAEHTRLDKAVKLNENAALQSASWGKFQIMGFNYKSAGFDSVQKFVKAMRSSEGKQLDAFVNFIKSNPKMHKALKNHDWATFAHQYNGSGYAQNQYDKKIAQAYQRFK